jgi:ubiquinone/menaquinone biosynthesis C-methylase UbiE
MTEGKYMASEMKLEADRERLSLIEQTWDPVTIRNLEMLGVSSGWKCLDVGAGYGSITSWLAERVGSNGKIVATDIRAELHHKVSETVEVRQHDILKDDLEKDYYDLVHCRSPILPVPGTGKALHT